MVTLAGFVSARTLVLSGMQKTIVSSWLLAAVSPSLQLSRTLNLHGFSRTHWTERSQQVNLHHLWHSCVTIVGLDLERLAQTNRARIGPLKETNEMYGKQCRIYQCTNVLPGHF